MHPQPMLRHCRGGLALLAVLSLAGSAATFQDNPDVPPTTFHEKPNGTSFQQALTIKPNEQLILEFPVQSSYATVAIKPEIDAKLDIQVYQEGAVVAKDVGGAVKTYFNVGWLPPKPGKVQLRIKSTDNIVNKVNVIVTTQKEGPPPPPNFYHRPIPFKENVVLKPKDYLLYHLTVKPGTTTFTVNADAEARLNIEITQNGTLVAREVDRKKSFTLTWDVNATGTATVKINNTDNAAANLEVGATAKDIGHMKTLPPLPPAGQLLQKNAPFSDKLVLGPNDNRGFQVPVQPGKCQLDITAQHGVPLIVQVKQNEKVVAEDGGLKQRFSLKWEAPAAAKVQVQVYCYDILTNPCTISFSQPAK